MDILLMGGIGKFTSALIDKLSKEGHRIYLLTGNEEQIRKPQKVFEIYRFRYDDACIKEVFESIKPQVTIFTGAQNPNDNWEYARETAAKYSAGLANTLMAVSSIKCSRFIYISSSEIFEDNYPNDIKEDDKPRTRQFKSMAILQGERQCIDYGNMMNLDVMILRLDNLYWLPQNLSEVKSIPDTMAYNVMGTGKIVANKNHELSLLYISDAIESIYKAIACDKHNYTLYNISSSQPIKEVDLAKLVVNEFPHTQVVVNSTGEDNRVILSNERFRQEFGLEIFHTPQQTIKLIATYMKRHKKSFSKTGNNEGRKEISLKEKLKAIFKAFVPFLENIVCVFPVYYINEITIHSMYFARFDFYLLYVLMFAVVYGQQQATLSAILAVIAYIINELSDKTTYEIIIDYNTYVWIVQLFVVGLVVGYLKDKIKMIKEEDNLKIDYLRNQLKNIENINNNNASIKNVLIDQIINQNDSFGKIYEITANLDKFESGEVLFYAAEALSKIMNTPDVAIYTVENDTYARLFSSTSQNARILGNSLEIKKYETIYDAIINNRVYINKNMEKDYPLMADGIFEEDKLKNLIMIWGIPWERMTLSQANKLRVVGYLIRNAVVRANKYLDALKSNRYVAGTHILEMDAFKELVKIFRDASNRNLTQCVILEIETNDDFIATGETIGKLLRQTDYMGTLDGNSICVLLSNTGREEAQFVTDRLKNAGFTSNIMEDI